MLKFSRIPMVLCALLLTACSGWFSGETDSESSSSSSQASSTNISRLCEEDDYGFEGKDINEWSGSWKYDEPNTTVLLDRPDLGFTANLPFNENWGNMDCKLGPYDENTDHDVFSFGFAGPFEGGGATRFNRLAYITARSSEAAMEEYTEWFQQNLDAGLVTAEHAPTVITINGNTVIKDVSDGLCEQTTYEVIGTQYNYLISSICDISKDDIDKVLETFTTSDEAS